MKALIWIGCMTINSIMQTILFTIASSIPLDGTDESALLFGLLKGFLSVVSIGLCMWIAFKLCKKYDWKKAMLKVAESGMTTEDYAKQGLTKEFLRSLPRMTYEKMKSTLKAEVRKGNITYAQCTILLDMYSWTPGVDQYPED